MNRASRRIQKEAEAFDSEIERSFVIENRTANEWIIAFVQLDSTIYAGEVHRIRVRFPDNYPLESPEVFTCTNFDLRVDVGCLLAALSRASAHIQQWPHMPQYTVCGLDSCTYSEIYLLLLAFDAGEL